MAGLQGRTLGGFQLSEQIASAGIAEVYRARPLAGNGREVVIKVIYPEFARYPSFLPNFQHIVQTAARLSNHPHILPVVASGEENGYLYLATPYVADGTLRDYLARGGRLGVADAGPFFQQLSGALAYAHSLGLVHGNLKPSNVFLYEGRHVMLGDFGMLWDIRQLDMNHSGSGTDVVEYLAPESFTGQFTQQSDIYSLGAILFATLTGRPPFSASKPADLRDAHMQFPPPRLGQVDPSLPPGVQAVDPIIQQAMAKRPEQRFPSASAFAQALDTLLKQQPAMPALPPAQPASRPALGGQPAAQPQVNPLSPGVPGSWAAPGPVGGLAALPAPAVARPLDPPFPPIDGGKSPASTPMSSGWPAAAEPNQYAEPIQYTERVPAPPVARPLFSRPNLQPNGSAPAAATDLWSRLAAGADDPEWGHNGWPAGPTLDDEDAFSRKYPAPQLPAPRQSNNNMQSRYSQHSEQSGGGFGMSRTDWPGGSQSGPHSEALRYRGGFSPTELGLPRLTNPALEGELPPEWEDLLADERLPRRADVGWGADQGPASQYRNPPSSFGYGDGRQPDAPNRPGSRPANPANDGQSYWQPSVGKPGGQRDQRDQPMRTLASAYQPAYNAKHGAQPPAAKPARARHKRRWPTLLTLVVLLLALVGGGGVVLAKPTLCPGTICTQANHFLHKHVGLLGPSQNANVLAATPNTLAVHATAGGTTNLNVQVGNTGTDPAVWHASITIPWITITPSSGTLAPGATATLSIAAHPINVAPGNYTAQLHVATTETALNIPLAAAIAVGPKMALSTNAITINSCNVAQPFKIKDTGDGPLGFTAKASDTASVKLDSTSGSVNPGSSATVNITINCSAFYADYTVSVSSNGGNGSIAIHYGP